MKLSCISNSTLPLIWFLWKNEHVGKCRAVLAASRATAANLLSTLVAELTGTAPIGKASAPSRTGLRGRHKQS